MAPLKDPHGFNFPQTANFPARAAIPASGRRATVAHIGLVLALGTAVWLRVGVSCSGSTRGFQLEVGGIAPRAARYAGFSSRRALWTALLVSGGLAGIAGALEVSGPEIGPAHAHFPVGYGFAAIHRRVRRRLHPLGVVLSALLMSMLYIGGELVQSRLGLPRALTGYFRGCCCSRCWPATRSASAWPGARAGGVA